MSDTAELTTPSLSRSRLVLLGTGLPLVVAVLPLAFSWKVAATFFAPKLLALYFGAGLVELGCLRLGGGEDGRTLRLDAADLLALGFIGWGLLACLTASSRWTAVLGLYNQGTGWLFWVACLGMWMGLRRVPWSPRTRSGLLVLIACAGTILGLVVLAQLARWEPLRPRIGFGPGGRPGGTLGNPLYCGSFLVLALLAALSVLVRRRTMYGRAAALGAAAVVGSALAPRTPEAPGLRVRRSCRLGAPLRASRAHCPPVGSHRVGRGGGVRGRRGRSALAGEAVGSRIHGGGDAAPRARGGVDRLLPAAHLARCAGCHPGTPRARVGAEQLPVRRAAVHHS